jgi:ribosomal-protein-serine acetyltransferase
MCLSISETAHLRLLLERDSADLHALIERNRAHLAPWLGWASTQTLDDTVEFIRSTERQVATNDGFHSAIVSEGHIVGVVSFMGIDWRHRRTLLGYWLDADHQGMGLMTAAVSRFVDHATTVWELNRVEIRAATENRKSRAIPMRLGFRDEGILRQAELVNGRYLDTIVYAMLASRWSARTA